MRRALPLGTLGAWAALSVQLASCRTPEPPLPPDLIQVPADAGADAELAVEVPVYAQPLVWQATAEPPVDSKAPDPQTQPFLDACGKGDPALHRVADHVANLQLQGAPEPDMAEVAFAMRSQGSAYVWPRVWTLEGTTFEVEDVVNRVRAWVARGPVDGGLRCGISKVMSGDKQVLAIVASDVLADLERRIGLSVRAGSWIDFEALLHAETSDASLVVMGPSGLPKHVPTSRAGQHVRSRFHADKPGRWVAQLLGSISSGPRPLLEVEIYADVPPPSSADSSPAPGEVAVSGPPELRLETWVNRVRSQHRLPALRRNPKLDALARAHAEAMRDAGRLAHDVGDGNPKQRMEEAGLEPRLAGENVARARSLERAHRALWLSPSHRGNLLHPRFTQLGIGVVEDPQGNLWVAELFASLEPD